MAATAAPMRAAMPTCAIFFPAAAVEELEGGADVVPEGFVLVPEGVVVGVVIGVVVGLVVGVVVTEVVPVVVLEVPVEVPVEDPEEVLPDEVLGF